MNTTMLNCPFTSEVRETLLRRSNDIVEGPKDLEKFKHLMEKRSDEYSKNTIFLEKHVVEWLDFFDFAPIRMKELKESLNDQMTDDEQIEVSKKINSLHWQLESNNMENLLENSEHAIRMTFIDPNLAKKMIAKMYYPEIF